MSICEGTFLFRMIDFMFDDFGCLGMFLKYVCLSQFSSSWENKSHFIYQKYFVMHYLVSWDKG